MDKVTDEALKRFATGHIGGLNTEAMAKEILELRAENARLKELCKEAEWIMNAMQQVNQNPWQEAIAWLDKYTWMKK